MYCITHLVEVVSQVLVGELLCWQLPHVDLALSHLSLLTSCLCGNICEVAAMSAMA